MDTDDFCHCRSYWAVTTRSFPFFRCTQEVLNDAARGFQRLSGFGFVRLFLHDQLCVTVGRNNALGMPQFSQTCHSLQSIPLIVHSKPSSALLTCQALPSLSPPANWRPHASTKMAAARGGLRGVWPGSRQPMGVRVQPQPMGRQRRPQPMGRQRGLDVGSRC